MVIKIGDKTFLPSKEPICLCFGEGELDACLEKKATRGKYDLIVMAPVGMTEKEVNDWLFPERVEVEDE